MIIAKYRITYLQNGISQTKSLISNDDYINIVKPTMDKIDDLKCANKGKHTKESKLIEKDLIAKFGEYWFTDKSPLFYAIESGVLSLPKSQGGDHPVLIKKIG